MKKRKKNNKPLIIFIIGLLLSSCVLGYSIYRISEHKKFLIEHKEEFEKNKATERSNCEQRISNIKNEIQTKENEIDALEKEITNLQREKSEEFMNSRGWSDRYYQLEDQITAKRKEISTKSTEIFNKKKEISDEESTIWKIDNDFDKYRYQKPVVKGIGPYAMLALGIICFIITLFATGISKLLKATMSEKSYSEYTEIDEGILSEIDVKDGVLLKKELFSKLEKLLLASSKGDYDTIRKVCTKNMARSYTDELDLIKKHKQKLVIKDITDNGSKIVSVRKGQHNTMVTIVQRIKLYDYTKDMASNSVVSGDEKKKQTKAFKLVFVKDFVKDHKLKKCPNCGSNIKDATKVNCEYCGTVFDNSNYDWYLESKIIINED